MHPCRGSFGALLAQNRAVCVTLRTRKGQGSAGECAPRGFPQAAREPLAGNWMPSCLKIQGTSAGPIRGLAPRTAADVELYELRALWGWAWLQHPTLVSSPASGSP